MQEQVESWTKRGVRQSKIWAERVRVNAQLLRLERQLKEQEARLGRAVYPMLLEGTVQLPTDGSDVRSAMERISTLAAEADRKRAQRSGIDGPEVGEPHGDAESPSERAVEGNAEATY